MNSNGLSYVVALAGQGDFGGPTTDTFRSDARAIVDWLLMVDTSPSFSARRADVRDNVERLLRRPSVECADLRVAFAPADGAADAGVRFSTNDAGSSWTSSLGDDFVNRALGAFDALPAGSETEACIAPAAQLMSGEPVRDGGHLFGLCITDALEQSPDPMAALTAFRGSRTTGQHSWGVVSGLTSSTCSIENADDGVHAALVQASNGVRGDICVADWASAVSPASSPCTQRLTFFLNDRPRSANELVVRIDGQAPPASAWSYDASNNAVVFVAGHEPQPGATLTVDYTPACLP